MKIILEKSAMGRPRSSTAQISLIVPPTLVIGAEEAMPALRHVSWSIYAVGRFTHIIRPASIVAMFLARQLGRVKMK
jgi:hypothetical protein